MRTRELDELIREARSTLGTTIVIVTHDIDRIVDMADHLIFLHGDEKGIIAEGTPKDVVEGSDDPRVREFFAPQSDREEAEP